jgi:hypothetical protein
MAANSKKTTMAKRNRESKLRDKRIEKQARKDARKLAALDPDRVEPVHAPDQYDPVKPDAL